MLKARFIFTSTLRNKNIIRNIGISSTGEKVTETKNLKSWKDIPGPSSLPFIGVTHNFLPGGELAGCSGYTLTDRLYQLYGPIVKFDASLGGDRHLFLFDPDAVEYIHRSEEPLPVRSAFPSFVYYRKRHNKTYDPDRVTGLATDQGKLWKDLRSAVNPVLMQPKAIQLYAGLMEQIADEMVARMRSVRDANFKIANLDEEMNLWSLESIGAVALGTRLNCLDPNLPTDSPARQLIQNIGGFFSVVGQLDFSPSAWRLFSTPTFKKAMKIFEGIESLSKYFIDQATKTLYESKRKPDDAFNSEKSVLEKLLKIDVQVAYITGAEMLLGGVDTTSNSVIATLYLLAKNPEKQKKLREEILTKQTRKPYLKACIHEMFRMLPPGFSYQRMTTKEYDILGYKIPTNTSVAFCYQSMGKLEKFYPRPDEFIPERWTEKDDPLYGHAHQFTLMPFGFGARTCLGRRIAQLELETIIPKIIENFQIDWPTDGTLQIDSALINNIKGPFHFVFKDIKTN